MPTTTDFKDDYATLGVVPAATPEDLVCDVPIRPDEAVLGAEISIPTPDGSVKMKVPFDDCGFR